MISGPSLGFVILFVVIAFVVLNSVKILPEYERGVVFRLGRCSF